MTYFQTLAQIFCGETEKNYEVPQPEEVVTRQRFELGLS
jgi:hypothetical protein